LPDGAERASAREEVDRLAADFLERYRRGDWPRMAEYIARHPALEAEIREVFPSLLLRERVGVAGPTVHASETPSAGAPPPSRRIGPYDTLLLLGSGGQGDVHLAEDTRLGRRVALKVLPRERAFGGRALERFRREAAITARLDHPGICTVYEAGEDGGTAWIAMKYVEGETLAQWTASTRGELVESADPAFARISTEVSRSVGDVRSREGAMRMVEIVEKAARALHAAHEAGLVHRDIKPGNIIVTPEREPVLLDFGLARQEGDDSALTLTGTLMGTPAYMSPEQLMAQRIALDRRTDVYSLGVTLYECLTLRLPFEAPTREQLYQRILTSDPEDARRHNAEIPVDLRVVLETALEKDRERRYRTALDLAEDLRRVRMREPIRARPAGPWVRLRRWGQRNPATAAATVSLFLALSAGLGASLHLLRETRRERDAKESARRDADRQRGEAEEARDATARALRRARALGLASASFEAEQRDPVLALHLAARAGELETTAAVMERLHGALAATREIACLPHGGEVLAVAWSPAGDRLATACDDGKARIWDASGRASAVLEGHAGPVLGVAFAEGGDRLLTVSRDGTARLWGVDGKPLAVLRGHGGPVRRGAALPGGGWATTSDDGTARLWSAEGGEGPVLPCGPAPVTALAIAPGGRHVAAGSGDGTARVFDREGRLVVTVKEKGDGRTGIGALAFSPAGDRLVAGARPGGHLWDLEGKPLASFDEHVNLVRDAAWSPDGKRFATSCTEGSVGLWSADGKLERKLRVPHQSRGNVSFSPDGSLLMACGADNSLRVWDADGDEVMALRGHRGVPFEARFSRDGGAIASASSDGTARIWRLRPGEIADLAPLWPGETTRMAVSAERSLVGLCSWKRNEARVFDLEGRPVATLTGHTRPIRHISFSRDGSEVVTGSEDGTARVWDSATGSPRSVIETGGDLVYQAGWAAPEGPMYATDGEAVVGLFGTDGRRLAEIRLEGQKGVPRIAFSPVARLVATGGFQGDVRLFAWDGTPRSSWRPEGIGTITALQFTPAGDRLVTGSTKGQVALWDLDGKRLATFDGHTLIVTGASFSADGRLLLTTSWDLTARLWDVDGKPRAVLRGHLAEVGAGTFLAGGERILTSSSVDGTVQVWSLDGRPLDVLRNPGNLIRQHAPVDGGNRLVTMHEDGSVRVWTLDPKELVGIARRRLAVRPLSEDDSRRYADLLGELPPAAR
jgi:WD40 repeat protein/serine/threonine protein kinase